MVAAPWVRAGVSNHAGAHRIQVEVRDQFKKIRIGIDQDSLVAPLEKMAGSFHPPIDPGGIAEGDVVHDAGKRDFSGLDGEMDVVCHEAEGVNVIAVFFSSFLQEQVKAASVAIFEEHFLSGVPSQNDVIEGAGIVYALFAGHGGSIYKLSNKASLAPEAFP